MLPNSTQAQTTAATVVAGAAGYAAGHGWLGLDNSAWGLIFTALTILVPAVWPAVVTRLQALKTTVGNSGALVVTNAASATASPSPNVVPASQVSSATLAKAQ